MSKNVIVLNADYTFLNFVSEARAVVLVLKKKAEILGNPRGYLSTITERVAVPAVIRLIKIVREIYKGKVPYSKKHVFVRDKYICQYCGKKLEKRQATLDHVIPRTQGGKSTWENSVCSCKKCNQEKGGRTPREAKMTMKSRPVQPTIMEFTMIYAKAIGIDKVLKDLGIF